MAPVFFLLFLSLPAIAPGVADAAVIGESSSVSEMLEETNKDLNFLHQGDIAMATSRNADPCTASGCKWPKSKNNVVLVPYVISKSFKRKERQFIINVLDTFRQSTCIQFVRRRKQSDYISFIPGTGCWSYLGRQSGQQQISLQRNGCLYQSIVQHEVLHALGFHHEHTRSDRDDYVEIKEENIIEEAKSNFYKRNTNNLGTPYDFDSVMQYRNNAFSKNGEPTIVAKDDINRVFGRATSMSNNDFERVNRLYEC